MLSHAFANTVTLTDKKNYVTHALQFVTQNLKTKIKLIKEVVNLIYIPYLLYL